MNEVTTDFYGSIGASQCAAVMGLDKHCSPYTLWRRFVDPDERPNLDENENVLWGNLLQGPIADEAARRWGFKEIVHNPPVALHPKYDFIRASPDALIVGESAGMEVKSRGINMAKFYAHEEDVEDLEDCTDAVLPTEALQAHHSLWVTGLDTWYLAVLLGGQRLRQFVIKRDEALNAEIERRCVEFWGYVQNNEPPPPINSADAAKLWPHHIHEKSVEANDAILDLILQRKVLKSQLKDAKASCDSVEFQLKCHLKDAEQIVHGGKRVLTWKTQERSHFDIDFFRVEHPDLAAAFTEKKLLRVMR